MDGQRKSDAKDSRSQNGYHRPAAAAAAAPADDGAGEEENGDDVDPIQRHRVYKSACIYLSIILYRVGTSLLGPTLPHLEILMDTDLQNLSMALMAKSIGFLSGSLLVGLVMDVINQELFFFLTTLTLGLFIAIAPCTGSVYGFTASMFAIGMVAGNLAAGGQAYIIRLWEDSKWKQPTTQSLHAFFCVGALFGPLLARPFLASLSPEGTPVETTTVTTMTFPNSTVTSLTEEAVTGMEVAAHLSTVSTHNATSAPPIDVSTVMYPYIITGMITLMSSLLFLGIFIRERRPFIIPKQLRSTASTKRKNPLCVSSFMAAVLVLVMMTQIFFAVQEHIPGNFLATFVIRGLGWDVIGGSTISAVYFGCFLAGRLVGIAVSMVLSPTAMLLVNMPVTTASFVFMCFLPELPAVYTYLSVGMAAFFMASTTATLYLWCSQYISITGRVAAIVASGYSLGDMAAQPLTAYLLEKYSPMFVVYVPLAASVAEICLFVLLNVTAKCFHKPQCRRNNVAYHNVELKNNGNPDI